MVSFITQHFVYMAVRHIIIEQNDSHVSPSGRGAAVSQPYERTRSMSEIANGLGRPRFNLPTTSVGSLSH